MPLSENEIKELTKDLKGTDHDGRNYKEKAEELLTILNTEEDISYRNDLLRYYGRHSENEIEAFGEKVVKYYETKEDYEGLCKFLDEFFIYDSGVFELISQKTRAKLSHLDNDFVIQTLTDLYHTTRDRERFREYVEEDLVYAIADAGKYMSNVGWYFTGNDHKELEKKIVTSLPDDKVKIFIRSMFRHRLVHDRMIHPFIKSGIISKAEIKSINEIQEINNFQTIENFCKREFEKLEESYKYFRDINRIDKGRDFQRKKDFSGPEFQEFKEQYINMIDALDQLQIKLTEYVNSLPPKEEPPTPEIDFSDLPF